MEGFDITMKLYPLDIMCPTGDTAVLWVNFIKVGLYLHLVQHMLSGCTNVPYLTTCTSVGLYLDFVQAHDFMMYLT